jgi:hypothetical protein
MPWLGIEVGRQRDTSLAGRSAEQVVVECAHQVEMVADEVVERAVPKSDPFVSGDRCVATIGEDLQHRVDIAVRC